DELDGGEEGCEVGRSEEHGKGEDGKFLSHDAKDQGDPDDDRQTEPEDRNGCEEVVYGGEQADCVEDLDQCTPHDICGKDEPDKRFCPRPCLLNDNGCRGD